MEKKYQVFVSSTFEDLKEERAEVIKALLEMDCFPCGMEFFPAANEDSWLYIEKLIKECDYYIVIVAGRYGSLTDEGISYTQKEYECALQNGVPALAFVHAAPEELPAKKTEKDAELQKKLDDFIKLLQKRLCCMWKSQEELNSRVVSSMYKLMKSTPRTGWIPSNMGADPGDAMERIRLMREIQDLKDELERYKGEATIVDKSLSSNDDVFDARVKYEVRNFAGGKDAKETYVKATWNDIFKMISPSMANGCTVDYLDEIVDKLYVAWFLESDPRLKLPGFHEKPQNVHIAFESLNAIKAQFLALGLIQSDIGFGKTNGRWFLTAAGRKRMLELSAIRRPVKAGRSTKK